jgi:hypothetical protein
MAAWPGIRASYISRPVRRWLFKYANPVKFQIIYRPFETSSHVIRLLELLPEHDFQRPVRCKLHHVTLPDDPKYEAISYCWGNAKIKLPVYVDGGLHGAKIFVTANLCSRSATISV